MATLNQMLKKLRHLLILFCAVLVSSYLIILNLKILLYKYKRRYIYLMNNNVHKINTLWYICLVAPALR